MSVTKQDVVWKEEWLTNNPSSVGRVWLTAKIDAFFSTIPGCMVRKDVPGDYDSGYVQYDSKGSSSSFIIRRYGNNDIQYRLNDTGCLINLGVNWSGTPRSCMTYLESDRYLLIKCNNGDATKNLIAFVKYGDSAYCTIINNAGRIEKYKFITRADSVLEVTPDAGSQLAPDEILLGQYFNNGVLIENVYSCTQTNIPRMMPFEVAGLGMCILTEVGLVKL